MGKHEDFYIGWQDRAPTGLIRQVRIVVLLVIGVAVILAALLIRGQGPFARSDFEYGVIRQLSGVVTLDPYPMLLMPRPGSASNAAFSTYPVVAFGKFGADAELQAFDGRAVTLDGVLIYRDGRTMIQIESGSVEQLQGVDASTLEALPRPTEERLGEQTLIGEIVDAKCFWGVMKPGNLKPHRSCAVGCIRGGLPPILLVRDSTGGAEQFLLVGADGGAVNQQVLDMVAEPVEITGQVVRFGELLILRSDPASYRRRLTKINLSP